MVNNSTLNLIYMKKIILILLVLCSLTGNAQDSIPKFQVTPDGIAPIVLQLNSMAVSDIYKKTLNYVQEYYKNPKEVLKADIPNELVRINGFKKEAWAQKLPMTPIFYYDMDYTLEIEMKENKVRLSLTPNQFWAGDIKGNFTVKDFFLDTKAAKKFAEQAKPGLENAINEISQGYYNYLKGLVKKDNW